MITFQTLKFSNWFSYGPTEQVVELDSNTLTQILGENGIGKSSIPLIIEEILYGKNSKGIKKQDLANRNNAADGIRGELVFIANSSRYKVVLKRKSSLSLTLFKDGKDISSHTSSGTYNSIENILGLDFKMFSQLMYQSSTSNLQFLTATDTTRKKFLINLFKLDNYTNIHEKLKSYVKETQKEVAAAKGSIVTTRKWLTNAQNSPTKTIPLINVPEQASKEETERLQELGITLRSLAETNKKIQQNNHYIKATDGVDIMELQLVQNPDPEGDKLSTIKTELADLQAEKKVRDSQLKHHSNLGKTPKCPTCGSDIDTAEHKKHVKKMEKTIEVLNFQIKDKQADLYTMNSLVDDYNAAQKKYKEFEDNVKHIDNSLPRQILDRNSIQAELTRLQNTVNQKNKEHQRASQRNEEIKVQNGQIEQTVQTIKQYEAELKDLEEKHAEIAKVSSSLEILKNAFSTSGLLSYKLEYLVQDLESLINNYLAEFSRGKFNLMFNINGDKLDISILRDETQIDIDTLSSGELGRVNISTLLAIRAMMSKISKTKLNILFLDEIMGVLDEEGKETLIDLLLRETELNTFIVSHEWEHPLVPKIAISRNGQYSEIENGGQ
jgi:DNA repair exonuclease SbcCD ATPase subunit